MGQPSSVDVSSRRRSAVRRMRRIPADARAWRPARVEEAWRERLEVRRDASLLTGVRNGRDVCWTEGERDPLVTVRIATFDRPRVLVERALASALRQTYSNIEVVVVGDHAGEETRRAIDAVGDPRVRYFNLPARPPYPADAAERWLVAGYAPMNLGNDLARGAWIAPCDDDDELTDDHVEVLLRHAQMHRLEFVWSATEVPLDSGGSVRIGGPRLREGHVTHGSVLHSSALRFMRYSATSYKRGEPFDWNLWRRMRAAGVRMGYLDSVTYRYYPSPATRDAYTALHERWG